MSSERDPLLGEQDGDADREHDQAPTSHLTRFRNGKFTPLEKVLIALASAFFVSLCVLTGLYARRIYEEKPDGPPGSIPSPPGDENPTVSAFMHSVNFFFSPFSEQCSPIYFFSPFV